MTTEVRSRLLRHPSQTYQQPVKVRSGLGRRRLGRLRGDTCVVHGCAQSLSEASIPLAVGVASCMMSGCVHCILRT